ncbi:MAG: nicotinate-nucleotide--dimethylbenzimidazole phosphoribosyltransferase [Acidobacteriaceae bacterium]|nr:nicotinate-nucleotide--dimethylbenzimidazole phosphoribosyltransferase [Acidobacteriaceae bacterium]
MKLTPALSARLVAIQLPDPSGVARAREHLDRLTKPIGSLGRLENLAAKFVAAHPGHLTLPLRKAVYVFAADHGIVSEGVSAYPQEVTLQMVRNFANGGAAINALARQHHAALLVVDVGVNGDISPAPGLHVAKVGYGTQNFASGPAMTQPQLSQSFAIGFELADRAAAAGQQLIAVGEMGIGNTTSASAITALLTGHAVHEVTGRGAGLDDNGLRHKQQVLQHALDHHFPRANVAPHPLAILQTVGGFEIAAMAGFILGLAGHRLGILCDGFISTSAAALAFALSPDVKHYLYAAHCSEEPGHRHLLDYLGLVPILNLGMRLGEGTGAVLAMPILESALHLYQQMATFASAGISEPTIAEVDA